MVRIAHIPQSVIRPETSNTRNRFLIDQKMSCLIMDAFQSVL